MATPPRRDCVPNATWGLTVMLPSVVLVASAGFGRDRVLHKSETQADGFAGGLVMSILAGILP